MEINLQTKVGALLEAYPALEDTLLDISPAFAKLRNPVLRRTIAKVATLQQAAKVAGISPALLIQTLRKAAGLTGDEITETGNDDIDSGTPPVWFDEEKIAIRFDATSMIDSGQSPMQDIMRLSGQLGKDEIMELTAPFKPAPILDLLKLRGFAAWYNSGKVYFYRL